MLQSEHGEKDLAVISKKLGANFPSTERISHRAGTTGIIILLTKDRFYAANVGDSRAVLSRGHLAIPLSIDHKPETPSEKNRIQRAGGFVDKGRVNGTLSLSRSLGDF